MIHDMERFIFSLIAVLLIMDQLLASDCTRASDNAALKRHAPAGKASMSGLVTVNTDGRSVFIAGGSLWE